MNLIYKDYCKFPVYVEGNSDMMDIKNMVNPNRGLVDYLDNESEDKEEDDNNTDAAERMQRQASNELNPLQ